MKTKKEKVPVSERALIQRINRKLIKDYEVLKKSRAKYYRNLGEYYIVNIYGNHIVATGVDLEAQGKELGVLAEYEKLGNIEE